jgi:hypothetical protein
LVDALAASARGPKRNGLFALWLVVRHCEGQLPLAELSPRSNRRRLEALERRLSSLSLPAPLKRGIGGAVRGLREGRPDSVAGVLLQLVAPARETLGPEAAEAVTVAARAARDAVQPGRRGA